MAYPGSPLYQQALEAGWRLPASWSGYSQHSIDCTPLATRHLTADEVLAFRDAAFDEYFSDPRYLASIECTFGTATLAEIRAMAAHRLRRRHAHTVSASPPLAIARLPSPRYSGERGWG